MPHYRLAALFSCSLLAFVVGVGSSPKVLAQPFIDIDMVAPEPVNRVLVDEPFFGGSPVQFDTYRFDTDSLRVATELNGLGNGLSPITSEFDFYVQPDSQGFEVAVFVFDSINVSKNIIATGSRPLAILSRGDATFSGTIDVSGKSVDGRPAGAIGDNGAGSGGKGQGGGNQATPAQDGTGAGGGAASSDTTEGESGNGGSYGGFGGRGFFNANAVSNPYGDLTQVLLGGSGGGGGDGFEFLTVIDGAGGGAGGGAIELGAKGNLTVLGNILSNGGNTTDGESISGDHAGAGGGGSGGGVRLHGGTIDLQGQIEARGGRGDHQQAGEPEGGGGGGGRVLLVGDELVLRGSLPIDVAGGPGNTAGGTGVKEVLLDKLVIPTGENVQLFGNFGNAKLAPATSEYDQHYDVEVESGATLEAFKFAGTVGEVSLAAGSTLRTNIFSANTLISVERVVGSGSIELNHPLTITNGSGTTFDGNITLDDPLTIDSDTDYTIAGEINSGLSVNDDFDCCDVIKRGTGTLTLSGDNGGFRGDIVVEAGTLELTTSTAFGNSPNIIFPRAPRLRLNDGSTLLVSNSMSFDAPSNPVALSGAATMEVPDATQLTIESQVSGNGTLTKTGNGTLALSGSNTHLGGVIINDGTLLANNTEGSATGIGQVDVNNGGTLGGNGSVAGAIDVRSGGTVAPGTSAGSLTAGSHVTFNVDGRAHSILAIELGGTTQTDEYDLLEVNGQVMIEDGAKLNVTLIDGFVPTAGDSFEILTAAGGITGTFDATLPLFLGVMEWKEIYTPTTLSLEFILPGDFNNDGIVDGADYTVWRDNEGMPAGTLANDPHQGVIGAAQYDTWVANFGNTSSTVVAVPEPGGLVLFFLLSCGSSGWRRDLCDPLSC